jgi:hypothetical protein
VLEAEIGVDDGRTTPHPIFIICCGLSNVSGLGSQVEKFGYPTVLKVAHRLSTFLTNIKKASGKKRFMDTELPIHLLDAFVERP